ncbi:LutC/YkgG family protein [Flammeovirga pacifica]|uniref:LUD domain-containing protein n=1 Tax=Flammeovirga pacifica TaxID=915059 RepID=A0A1S1YS93_FLAPC|nr:LUD domain-containing protein [Flammeovirga pacifica]OHX63904.1 hypothetical protein NH26_20035 [Flammeovirga pacifica]
MSSKSSIIDAIRNIEKEEVHLPRIPYFEGLSYDSTAFFLDMLQRLGVEVIQGNSIEDIPYYLQEREFDSKKIFTQFSELPYRKTLKHGQLESIQLSILNGKVAVAENGAIWVTDERLSNRALTVIGEHLLIAISKRNLVWNMHEAYANISIHEHGYGMFISGPSKTADIEQSLVKGAHGSKSLIVFIYE